MDDEQKRERERELARERVRRTEARKRGENVPLRKPGRPRKPSIYTTYGDELRTFRAGCRTGEIRDPVAAYLRLVGPERIERIYQALLAPPCAAEDIDDAVAARLTRRAEEDGCGLTISATDLAAHRPSGVLGATATAPALPPAGLALLAAAVDRLAAQVGRLADVLANDTGTDTEVAHDGLADVRSNGASRYRA